MKNTRALDEVAQRIEGKLNSGKINDFFHVFGVPHPKISEDDLDEALRDVGYSGLIVKNTCVLCGHWVPPDKVSRRKHKAQHTLKMIKLIMLRSQRKNGNKGNML